MRTPAHAPALAAALLALPLVLGEEEYVVLPWRDANDARAAAILARAAGGDIGPSDRTALVEARRAGVSIATRIAIDHALAPERHDPAPTGVLVRLLEDGLFVSGLDGRDGRRHFVAFEHRTRTVVPFPFSR